MANIDFADLQTTRLDLYVNGDTGNDDDDGLTVAKAKKTLAAVAALIPKAHSEHVVVNMRGTFTDESSDWSTISFNDKYLVLDGGTDLAIIAGVFTATDPETSTTTIGDSAQSWTVDAFAGYWVEVLSGAASGELRTIYSNTATTLTVMHDWSTDPLVNATFRIVRPATTLTTSAGSSLIRLWGPGNFQVSRLYFSGTGYSGISATDQSGKRLIRVNSVIHDSTQDDGMSFVGSSITLNCEHLLNDPDNSMAATAATSRMTPLSVRQSRIQTLFGFYDFSSIWADDLYAVGGTIIGGNNCARFTSILAYDVGGYNDGVISNPEFLSSGASTYRSSGCFGSSGVGLTAIGCRLYIGDADFSNHSSHGIEVDGGRMDFNAITTGSSNTGAGLYAHGGAEIVTASGSKPTLTGTVGEFSIDGTNQASTWTALSDEVNAVSAFKSVTAMINGELQANGGTNGQSIQFDSLTELTTIAASAFTDTTIQIPADAIVYGVSTRVTVQPGGTSTMDVGVSGATTRYGTGISTAAATTSKGTIDSARYYGSTTAIRITPNTTPSDALGRVRVTIHFIEVTAPTS